MRLLHPEIKEILMQFEGGLITLTELSNKLFDLNITIIDITRKDLEMDLDDPLLSRTYIFFHLLEVDGLTRMESTVLLPASRTFRVKN